LSIRPKSNPARALTALAAADACIMNFHRLKDLFPEKKPASR
jgi:hypothetical protein